MPTLSDKLKALGVNIGADGIKTQEKIPNHPIESVVEGEEIHTPFGNAFVIEEIYNYDPRARDKSLDYRASLYKLSSWIG
ncbi:MAG: hypothetical protein JSV69_04375, partial [Chloroflexota bacterium]